METEAPILFREGAIDRIAHLAGITNDHDLAFFLGVRPADLAELRYQRKSIPLYRAMEIYSAVMKRQAAPTMLTMPDLFATIEVVA